MSVLTDFPSADFFGRLVNATLADEAALIRLGIAEIRFGVEVVMPDGERNLYGIVFDGYDIKSVGSVSEVAFAPDVVVSGQLVDWSEMFSWIAEHGPADSPHSLNGMTIAGVPLAVRSSDAMGSDRFFRFMGTIQAVFDAAAMPSLAAAER